MHLHQTVLAIVQSEVLVSGSSEPVELETATEQATVEGVKVHS